MRNSLPELIALPLLPLLLVQGRRTRAKTPRMPEADGERAGIAMADSAGAPLRLIAIGESPVAGVGVALQEEAITARLAQSLAMGAGRPVHWRAYGRNGATVRDALAELLPQVPAEPVDILLVAFGVNDSVAFRRVSEWQRDMLALLDQLRERCSPAVVLLSGVPPMQAFPALPHPLRWVLGMKAAALDRGLQALAREDALLRHVPLVLDTQSDSTLAAEDGYHPSAKGCNVWARMLAEAYLEQRT
ncbi:SGNH/GDSL hydrolase family protein [Pseudoduganella violaceinigra]|uniref:SGNH/GDSL hydrolase family protein n=1 Tax=Pseudoduganella violaceinigra TaxID=246602 RepID=UPI00041FB334|nr:SGNH/GDSL hydrolase family protein [Pseudoduganella violaceinigra]